MILHEHKRDDLNLGDDLRGVLVEGKQPHLIELTYHEAAKILQDKDTLEWWRTKALPAVDGYKVKVFIYDRDEA